jgi:UDP-N-acetylmuramoyl-tripeptide--D-alanyl-D-alanine ligase
VARSPGNWNNDIGLPLSLLRTELDAEFGVFEIGMNHAGEIQALSEVLRPDIGIVTNVGPAHLEFFDSEADIASEKADLLRALPCDGMAIVACDAPWFEVIREAAPCPVTTVAIGETADYEGILSATDPGAFTVHESATGDSAAFRSALPGAYFKRNALLAVACCRRLGVGWDDLVRVVGAYVPEALRWNVHRGGGVTLIDDSYNANPISMRAAIQAFEEMPIEGGRWLVLGGMLELGPAAEGLHRALGGVVASGSWKGLIGYGPWGRHIADGAARAGMPAAQIACCEDYGGVIEILAAGADAGDAVLLKASRGERLERIRELWLERRRDQGGVRTGIGGSR